MYKNRSDLSPSDLRRILTNTSNVHTQRVTGGYTGLKRVAGDHKELQKVTGGYRGLERVTRGYRGLQGVAKLTRRYMG